MDTQGIRCALDHLIRVGVIERITRRVLVAEVLMLKNHSRTHEVLNASCPFTLFECGWNRYLAVQFYAGSPKLVIDLHRGKRDRLNGVVAFGQPLSDQNETNSNQRRN